MPKISICIPTYNNLEAFKRCLNSILIQTYTDYEVIITDDSTNHDIETYINSLQNIPSIHYYKNPTTLGSPENWNESLRKAKGEYIKILHHDDWFTDENSLSEFIKSMEKYPEISFGFCESLVVNLQNNEIINQHIASNEWVQSIINQPERLLEGNKIGAPSATIFKNPNCFFDNQLIWLVDIDFYYTLIKNKSGLLYIQKPLICTGIHDNQITKTAEKDKKINLFEFFYLLNKYGIKEFSKFPKLKKNMTDLLFKFKVIHKKEIRKTGFKGGFPNNFNKSLLKNIYYIYFNK